MPKSSHKSSVYGSIYVRLVIDRRVVRLRVSGLMRIADMNQEDTIIAGAQNTKHSLIV